MGWIFFTNAWGLGNLFFGLVLNSVLFQAFGMGILFGGLSMALARDFEKLKEEK